MSNAPAHYSKTPERAPFLKGREPVKLTQAELKSLNASADLRPRTLAAVKAVLVERLPYSDAAHKLGETAQYVRSAVIWGMERLGLSGARAFENDPTNRLIIDGVPERFHTVFTTRVLETLAKLLEQEAAATAPVWETPAEPAQTEDKPPVLASDAAGK